MTNNNVTNINLSKAHFFVAKFWQIFLLSLQNKITLMH